MRHLLAFFVLGGLLFAARRGLEHRAAEPPSLVVSVPRTASDAEVARAVDRALLTDLALSGPALSADPVVRDQVLRSLGSVESGASEGELVKRSLALGVQRVDPVVRERLAFQGEQMLRAAFPLPEPGDDELARYLAAHRERYLRPERVTFTQVFVSRSLHGARAQARAQALLRSCARGPSCSAQPALHSDPTILPFTMALASAREIDARFGPGMAEHVSKAELGAWTGPVRSAYGLHLVLVQARAPAGLPALHEIRERVRSDAMHDASGAALQRALARLKQSYRVEVQRVGG